MTLPPADKTDKTDKTPEGEKVIWLHHEPAIMRLQMIAWLAYPRADRAAKAFDRLTWWHAAERGQTVPEKPSRLNERLASIDDRLRERALAGFLYAAKVRRYRRSEPPWSDLVLEPKMARLAAAMDAAMDAAQPPGTREVLRRINEMRRRKAGENTWVRKLLDESRPVAHLAASWIEHSGIRFTTATLREIAFPAQPDARAQAILRNAEGMRTRIAADPSNNTVAADMLRFIQCPSPLGV